MGGATIGTGSCMVAVGGVNNRTRGRAISDPEDALGEGRDKIGGVKLGVKTSKAAYARSIRGSIIPDISSSSPDGNDKVGRSSWSMDTF